MIQATTTLTRAGVIEALIGHMKNDGLLGCNWLKGKAGDAMHVVLCTAGQNLRLILKAIAAFLRVVWWASIGSLNRRNEHSPHKGGLRCCGKSPFFFSLLGATMSASPAQPVAWRETEFFRTDYLEGGKIAASGS